MLYLSRTTIGDLVCLPFLALFFNGTKDTHCLRRKCFFQRHHVGTSEFLFCLTFESWLKISGQR